MDENEDEILLNFNMNEEEQSADSESVQAEETDEAGPVKRIKQRKCRQEKIKEAIGRSKYQNRCKYTHIGGTSKKNFEGWSRPYNRYIQPKYSNTALAAHRSHTYGRMFQAGRS